MGNPRSFTTKLNANNEALRTFLRAKRCTTLAKRKAAMERAATMPNSLPASSRALLDVVSVKP